MSEVLSDFEAKKANTKTFLKLLKSNYSKNIKGNSLWNLEFKKIVHNYKKHSDNHEKMIKIYKKTVKLFEDIKK